MLCRLSNDMGVGEMYVYFSEFSRLGGVVVVIFLTCRLGGFVVAYMAGGSIELIDLELEACFDNFTRTCLLKDLLNVYMNVLGFLV